MTRFEILKEVRRIYQEVEKLKSESENEKSKNHENRNAVSEVDTQSDKNRKVQN